MITDLRRRIDWHEQLLVLGDQWHESGVLPWGVGLAEMARSRSRSEAVSGSVSRSGSGSGARSGAWSRSGSGSGARSGAWSRSGSGSGARPTHIQEDEMEIGEVYWIEPLATRAYVGRVVDLGPLEVVIVDAVQIHEHGDWQSFHAGVFNGSGQRAHVSRCPDGEPLTLPRIGSLSMRFRGDLAALRAWGDQ